MATAVAIKVPGLFQLTKRGEQSWSCLPAVYGSAVAFKAMELSQNDLESLFKTFRLPLALVDDHSFIVEFADDMPVERLSKFGFRSSEQSYAI